MYITRRKTCAEHLGQRKTDRERETKVIMRESEAAIQFMVLRPQKTPNIHNGCFELWSGNLWHFWVFSLDVLFWQTNYRKLYCHVAKITCDSGATRLNLQKLQRQLYADACIRILLTHNSKSKFIQALLYWQSVSLAIMSFLPVWNVDMKEIAKQDNLNA